MKRILSLLIAAALLCGAFALPAAAAPAQTLDTEGFAAEVLQRVNAERKKAGLPALGTLDALSRAAQKRAEEIAVRYDHKRPGGAHCFTVLEEYGVISSYRGENIAKGYATPADVMAGWLNSSGHKKNILGDFSKIGVGVYVKNGKIHWVQLFIREGAAPAPAWKSWPRMVQFLARVLLFGWLWMK